MATLPYRTALLCLLNRITPISSAEHEEMLVAQVSVNLIREFPGVREGEIAPLCHEVDDTICLPGYLVGELGGERIQIIEGSGLHFRDEMIHRRAG